MKKGTGDQGLGTREEENKTTEVTEYHGGNSKKSSRKDARNAEGAKGCECL